MVNPVVGDVVNAHLKESLAHLQNALLPPSKLRARSVGASAQPRAALPLSTAADDGSPGRRARSLLGLPNNYGNATHARVHLRNNCVVTVNVAVMYVYHNVSKYVPTGCSYLGVWRDSPFGPNATFCLDYFWSVSPGQLAYLGDTGFSTWYWTAVPVTNTSLSLGSQMAYDLTWQACIAGSPNCYLWNAQESLLLAEHSAFAKITCSSLIPKDVTPYDLWKTYYDWPRLTNNSRAFVLDTTISVLKDPGSRSFYNWHHLFGFTHKRPASKAAALPENAQALFGLETWGAGRGVTFAVFNGASGKPDPTLAAQKLASCETIKTAQLTAASCSVALKWVAGVAYRFQVTLFKRVPAGDTFRATVADPRPAGKRYVIGDIFVPAFYGSPSRSLYLYTIYDTVPSCATFPAAKAQFGKLSLISSGKTFKPVFSAALIPEGNGCAGWASLDVCGTTATGAGPLPGPIDPNGPAVINRCAPSTCRFVTSLQTVPATRNGNLTVDGYCAPSYAAVSLVVKEPYFPPGCRVGPIKLASFNGLLLGAHSGCVRAEEIPQFPSLLLPKRVSLSPSVPLSLTSFSIQGISFVNISSPIVFRLRGPAGQLLSTVSARLLKYPPGNAIFYNAPITIRLARPVLIPAFASGYSIEASSSTLYANYSAYTFVVLNNFTGTYFQP